MPDRNSRDYWAGPSRHNHGRRDSRRVRGEDIEAELDEYLLDESSSPTFRDSHRRREERYDASPGRRNDFRHGGDFRREHNRKRSKSPEWRDRLSPRGWDGSRSKTDAALEVAARLNKKYERVSSRSVSPHVRSSHRRRRDSRSPRRKRWQRSPSRSPSRSPPRRYAFDKRRDSYSNRERDRKYDNRGRRWSHSDGNRGAQYHGQRQGFEFYGERPDDSRHGVPRERDAAFAQPPLVPPPPPPAEDYPRSPNITDRLESLAASQGVPFDSAKGIEDVELFRFRLNQMELGLLGPNVKSWEEQEELCRLLILQHGLRGAEEDGKEPFSGENFQEYFQSPGHTGHEIPYEQLSSIEDPRLQFSKEYEFMSAWAGKPRPLPGFVDEAMLKKQNGDQSPTHSWSASPSRAGEPPKRKTQRPEPKPQTKVSMSSRPSTGGKSASVPRDLHMMGEKYSAMELEEGYFSVKLVNGQDTMLQYDEIVDLIKKGDLPDNWPAYREWDSLWISVSAKGDQAADLPRHPTEEQKASSPLSGKAFWETSTRDTKTIKEIKSWFKSTAKVAAQAFVSRGNAIHLQYTRCSLQDCRRLTQQPPTRDFEFENESKMAFESIQHQERIMKLRREGKIRGKPPRQVSHSTLAMIKGHILMDRSKLKEIGTGALQKAIKAFKERQKRQ